MASPAAVLSVLVQAEGINRTTSQLRGLHGDLGKAGKAGGQLGKDLDSGAKHGSRALGGLKSAAGFAGVALGAAGIAGAMKTAISEFQEARKVGANTNQVIKTTGGVANVSAKHVANLATSISKKVGIDDEAIQSGSNLLLTFKNVRNETGKGKDVFDQATKAAVDLSAAGFGSLHSTSIQLGKALNDPVKGMTALGRSGVTFSEQQKSAIAALLKTGKAADRVKAQQIILKEVQSQVGGQAAKQATTMDHLKVTLSNLAEAAGSVLVPALDTVGKFLNTLINQMIDGKGVGGQIVSVFKAVGGAIGAVVGTIKGIIDGFQKGNAGAVILVGTVGALAAGILAYKAVVLVTTAVTKAMAAAQVLVNLAMEANPIGIIIAALVALAAGLAIAYMKSETFRAIVDKVWAVIKTVAGAVWNIAKVVFPAFIGGIVSAATAVFDFITHLSDIPGKIVAAGSAIVNGIVAGIKALPGLLVDAAKFLWDTLKAGLEAYLAAYKAVGSWVLDRIVDGFKVITGLLASVGGWLLDRFVGFIKAEIQGAKNIGSWILDRIVDGFKVVTGLLGTIGAWLKNRIFDFVKLEIEGAKNIGGWLLNRIVDGFKIVTDLLATVGGWIKNRIRDFVHAEIEGVTNIGGWLLSRIIDGFKTVTKLLNTVGDWLRGVFFDVIKSVEKGFVSIGSSIIGWIVDGLKGGLNLLIGFVNDIIHVINKIPGVNIKDVPKIKLAKGGTTADRAQGFAQGGVTAGGFVNKPIVMMGEEAPRHPEYVIPTNPAYRGRAAMLLGQAANAIGFQTGGIFNTQEMSDLWRSKGGGASIADTMGVIGLVESGGNPNARNPSGASGLWQILGQLVPGNIFNPGVNALNAIAKYKSQGLSAWDASKSKWGPLIGKTVGPDLNPLDLIKKLPGIGDLPEWLKGTGKYILDHVGDWIKSKVASVVPGGGPTASGPSGVGTFEGVSMANWVIGALKHARARGFTGHPTSGYRTHAENVAQGRLYRSEHEGIRYPHGAVDFGGFHTGKAIKDAFVAATADYRYPLLAPIGFVDDGHASGTGHAKGGIIGQGEPFVGSYARGGRVPADGFGYLHQGETVIPRGAGGGPLVHVEHMEVRNDMDLDRWARKLGWQLATGSA